MDKWIALNGYSFKQLHIFNNFLLVAKNVAVFYNLHLVLLLLPLLYKIKKITKVIRTFHPIRRSDESSFSQIHRDKKTNHMSTSFYQLANKRVLQLPLGHNIIFLLNKF